MKKVMKLWLVLAVCAVLCFAISACGDKEEDSMYYGDDQAENMICPLDGEEIEDAGDIGDYLFIVSVENGPDSEPQSGISEADLLIELPVEAGINRFMAFFYHHTPDTIGGVRSARHYFYDIVEAYDAIFALCGGSPQAYDVIDSGKVKDMDEMSITSSFHRTGGKKAPHNLYTSYEELSKGAKSLGYDTYDLKDCPSFDFYSEDEADALSFGGVSEFSLDYRYKAVSYRWDENEETYQRYSKGHLHMDDAADEAVTADNVVVLYIANSVVDDKGRLDMDIDSGEGELLQKGTVTEIDWDLESGNGFVFRSAEDGSDIKLIPGRTIIQIISPENKADYTKASSGDSEVTD